jgi:hypothetical protein
MARETGEQLNSAINRGAGEGLGMGESIGREILEGKYRYKDRSLLAAAVRLGIPATVHIAVGSDIHHMHPSADGAALGETSFRDFETLSGVVFNVGSVVILPELFLKALSLARNPGNPVRRLTAVNLDCIWHYRPQLNIIERPTRPGGRGYSLGGAARDPGFADVGRRNRGT